MSVKYLIENSDNDFLTCLPSTTLKQSVEQMVPRKRNAICVLDADGALAGILTEHDVMRALAENDGHLGDATVMDWMTRKVITCDRETKLTDALKMMGRYKIRHLIAVENGTPIAIIGIRDVLSKVHEQDEMEINVLRDVAVAAMTH